MLYNQVLCKPFDLLEMLPQPWQILIVSSFVALYIMHSTDPLWAESHELIVMAVRLPWPKSMCKSRPNPPHFLRDRSSSNRVLGSVVLIHKKRALAMIWQAKRGPRVRRRLLEMIQVRIAYGPEGLGDG